jgi:hypothetical protein
LVDEVVLVVVALARGGALKVHLHKALQALLELLGALAVLVVVLVCLIPCALLQCDLVEHLRCYEQPVLDEPELGVEFSYLHEHERECSGLEQCNAPSSCQV